MKKKNIQPVIFEEKKKREQTEKPIFSFEYLQSPSWKNCKKADFFQSFLQRLQKLSSLDWTAINKADRHSFGYEKIPISSIKCRMPVIPYIIGEDYLLAFRATGSNLPFLGFRENGNVFYIVFIETAFGEIYKHA